MTDRELEHKIRTAFSHAAPDILDTVLQDCQHDTERKVIIMKEAPERRTLVKRLAGIAAALVLVAVGAAGLVLYRSEFVADSLISLDVNPSVRIVTNARERVLRVEALNEDGQIILEGLDFKGSHLNVTVNALVGSMVRNGYLSELANSILISVDNHNDEKAADIQRRLAAEVADLLKEESFDGAVLSQTLHAEEPLEQLSEQYHMTTGKAQLINSILEKNPAYTFETLAPLSINELNLLCSSETKKPEQVTASGAASEKQYIGREQALATALAHANIPAEQATHVEVEMDYDDGVMEYEVEFRANNREYEYEIHAVDGTIRQATQDTDDDKDAGDNGTVSSGTTAISQERAKEIVLQHAEVTAERIREYSIELEEENGLRVYEIEFLADGYEYEYHMDADTGRILSREKGLDD